MQEKDTVREFFAQSNNVWVSENFQEIILSVYTKSESVDDNNDVSFQDLQDLDTETSPEELVFNNPDIFLEQLVLLIGRQLHGEVGLLLNDSSANYFYINGKDGKYYSVLVRWEQSQGLWRCGAYLQEELKTPNIRIFSPQ